ncbi:MAG TPA: Rpn family recombination-promoting nuclease/putative transposase [bacterium]|nr:Rpn family recombination-promoting nuclease/putative transposase [bacterium]HOL47326.1 Rpn family recombination-promoting nuclease/putative transposase [bacterium]HPQ17968.1 Rpn family recombination-promoting nuclease/putative transposase [bacterium]
MDLKNFKGLCNDIIFKYVFGSEKHTKILTDLLNAILNYQKGKQIKKTIILNPMNLQEKINDKYSVLDIKATDEKGRQYNIEMQVTRQKEYIARILFYLNKFFTEQLKEGENYEELKKTITISI